MIASETVNFFYQPRKPIPMIFDFSPGFGLAIGMAMLVIGGIIVIGVVTVALLQIEKFTRE